jgi:hypothetical protein
MNKRVRKVPPKSEFRDAILLNNDTYKDYLERIKKIALSMFVWENLPDTMNARYLEMCLYYKGQAALLYDNNYGFINTQAADSGYINIYGLPTLLNCFSYSYNSMRNLYVPESGEGKDGECILVMNTFERVPTCATVELFAYRLSQAQRSADTNVSVTRSSQLLLTDQKQYFTLKKMYEEYDGNTPAIFADKNLITPDSIKAIKTDTPIMLKELMDYKREIWNECLTALGVSNLNEKRERMVSAETDSNNEVVNLNLQSFLIPRQKAADEFNKKFGLTGDKAIKVRVRSDLYNIVKQYDSIANDYQEVLKDDLEVDNG